MFVFSFALSLSFPPSPHHTLPSTRTLHFSAHLTPVLIYSWENSLHVSINVVLSICDFRSRGSFFSVFLSEKDTSCPKTWVHPWANPCIWGEEECLVTNLGLLHPPPTPPHPLASSQRWSGLCDYQPTRIMQPGAEAVPQKKQIKIRNRYIIRINIICCIWVSSFPFSILSQSLILLQNKKLV